MAVLEQGDGEDVSLLDDLKGLFQHNQNHSDSRILEQLQEANSGSV